MSETIVDTQPVERGRTPAWLRYLLLIVFGLLFAYDVWEAIGNMVGFMEAAAGLGTSVNVLGWAVLLLGIVLPVILLVIAYWLGRKRDVLSQILLYLAGLGASAALFLSMNAIYGLGSFLN